MDAGSVSPAPDANPAPQKDAAVAPDANTNVDAGACAKVGPTNLCGLDPQCGCGPTGTCDVTTTAGETVCVSPAGSIAEGSYCTQTAGCQAGLTCRYGGVCHKYCSSPGATCAGGGQCIQLKDSADAGIPNFLVCEIKCSLENAGACGGTGAGCFESQHSPGTTDCYPAGTHPLNGACTYVNDCAAGLGCVSVGAAAATCKKWCRVGTNDCGASGLCTAFTPQYMLNGTQYGFCP